MRYLVGILIAGLIALSTLIAPVQAAIFAIAEKLPVLLAVLLAAVLVRLARGLPTIPFEKIKSAQALIATKAFRLLLHSYTQCLIVITIAIILNLLTKSIVDSGIWPWPLFLFSFLLAFFDALSVIVIYFLVSADIRISLIQADLMDQVTGAAAITSASASVDNVRRAFKKEPEREGPSVTPV